METYSELAVVYDRLMKHIDFSKVTDFYLKMAHHCKWQGENILDLACGTGNITLELMKRKYNVTGVDISAEMLTAADRKIYQAGFRPQLICRDIRELAVPRMFDLVISAFDSLNYLLKEKDILKTFANVNQSLVSGGFFIFDMHSEYRVKEIIGENIFTYQDDEVFYTWHSDYDAKRMICRMKLDVFAQAGEGLYRRIEEFHEQRYYPPDTIKQHLEASGFKLLAVYGDLKLRKPCTHTERIFYVAQRNS